MLIHQLPLGDAFATLRSAPEGLSRQEAADRRRDFGPNRIERLKKTPLALRFFRQFTHFFAVLLWVAALLALVAATMPGQGMATLAAAIVVVILVNGVFSFWQEYRAEETMTAGCDAIFLRDVYHHFTAPADMIQSMAASLKPGGRIAVIDFTLPPGSRAPTPADRAKDGMHGIHPDDLSQEMGNAGFELVRSEVGNRWFMLVFARKAER